MRDNEAAKPKAKQTQRSARLIAAIVVSAVVAAGCASTGPVNGDGQKDAELLVKDAEMELAQGKQDKAVALLNDAAREHPASVAPWLKLANIWFEAGNYPSAILAAQEVLQRDATNQDAKSLLVVAGLRVATNAVSGLRPISPASKNTRIEAENLTNSLRQALGETVLVPSPPPDDARPVRRVARSRPRPHPVQAVPERAREPVATSSTAASDPFKLLK